MLSTTAILGYGFAQSAFDAGMARNPHLIGADGGSSDPGPFYLATGESFCSRMSTKRDLKIMLAAAVPRGIPVIISTCGGAGGAPHLQMMVDLTREIAKEADLSFKLAVIPAELSKETLIEYVNAKKVRALYDLPAMTSDMVEQAVRIVGAMGPEPYIAALDGGAQVILSGRSTDPAPWAAMTVRAGFSPALGWYAGKMLECGAEPALPKREGCLLATVRDDHVELEPMHPDQRCTPASVAYFALHENSSPIHHHEPGGMLDTSECSFDAVSDRAVRVSGMQWKPMPYSVKLEGVEARGHRVITLCATRDPVLQAQMDPYLKRSREIIAEKAEAFGAPPDSYTLNFRVYGQNGVMGDREPLAAAERHPHETAVVAEVVAAERDTAKAVLAIARTTILHSEFPGRLCKEGNMGIPFSPSDLDLGQVYRFSICHLVEPESALSLFPIQYEHIGAEHARH
ncbi:acyclic terpene utilization AtuA family protein [Robbsia sp. KACC 23696]|uniref:acyclic terpene utilization AtuA family protein n=1 Tax=Robbsia sp. KACC 23696 TaxID=3149231 RepID=UPI00325BDECA